MSNYLLLIGTVILICILMRRYVEKLPVPSLLIFILLGMIFGENGIFRISFNNYAIADTVCSVSLIFIMFYGGFGINIKAAKPAAAKAVLLSTAGVIMTAGFTGLFVHFVLGLDILESILIGSVIFSTDAASVFNILKSKKLDLKYNTASLLELESGSNDPVSYMLTAVVLTLMSGQEVSVPFMLFRQLIFGIGAGVLTGWLAIVILKKWMFDAEHGRTIFVFAVAMISYALPAAIGGNGYLSVYLCGIIMGNSRHPSKRYLIHFFDVVTDVVQVLIFFLLGLLVTPVKLPAVFIPALLIMIFMTVIARPLSVLILLAPFKSKAAQIGLVSWAGLRGVASIVFAIMAVLYNVTLKYNLFNLVFCIVLLSISIQGTLLPWVSKKLKMIDKTSNVNKTFSDYQEENDVSFIQMHISAGHPWAMKQIRDIVFGSEMLISIVIRDNTWIVPRGGTKLLPDDIIVLAAKPFDDTKKVTLREVVIDSSHKWCGLCLKDITMPENALAVMVLREGSTLIPKGSLKIQDMDMLVIATPA